MKNSRHQILKNFQTSFPKIQNCVVTNPETSAKDVCVIISWLLPACRLVLIPPIGYSYSNFRKILRALCLPVQQACVVKLFDLCVKPFKKRCFTQRPPRRSRARKENISRQILFFLFTFCEYHKWLSSIIKLPCFTDNSRLANCFLPTANYYSNSRQTDFLTTKLVRLSTDDNKWQQMTIND